MSNAFDQNVNVALVELGNESCDRFASQRTHQRAVGDDTRGQDARLRSDAVLHGAKQSGHQGTIGANSAEVQLDGGDQLDLVNVNAVLNRAVDDLIREACGTRGSRRNGRNDLQTRQFCQVLGSCVKTHCFLGGAEKNFFFEQESVFDGFLPVVSEQNFMFSPHQNTRTTNPTDEQHGKILRKREKNHDDLPKTVMFRMFAFFLVSNKFNVLQL
jgi:hypothetical protein